MDNFAFAAIGNDGAVITRPIESYFDDKSDIDVLFGYTSAVILFIPLE